jgi:Flp pilus assembly CpaF family ATPase
MPPEFIRDLIANTMQVIVQTERQADGKYKISEIVEMAEFDGNSLRLSTMHRLQRQAPDQEGVVKYTFVDCEEKSRFI